MLNKMVKFITFDLDTFHFWDQVWNVFIFYY